MIRAALTGALALAIFAGDPGAGTLAPAAAAAQSWGGEYGSGYGGGYGGGYASRYGYGRNGYRGDHVDIGTILLGAVILGGVVAAVSQHRSSSTQGRYPQQSYPQQSYPQQGYPQQGYPQQSNVQQNIPRGAIESCAAVAQQEAARFGNARVVEVRQAGGERNNAWITGTVQSDGDSIGDSTGNGGSSNRGAQSRFSCAFDGSSVTAFRFTDGFAAR
jgi:hypothetical protein